MNAQVNKT